MTRALTIEESITTITITTTRIVTKRKRTAINQTTETWKKKSKQIINNKTKRTIAMSEQ
jgi:hypothetical protein